MTLDIIENGKITESTEIFKSLKNGKNSPSAIQFKFYHSTKKEKLLLKINVYIEYKESLLIKKPHDFEVKEIIKKPVIHNGKIVKIKDIIKDDPKLIASKSLIKSSSVSKQNKENELEKYCNILYEKLSELNFTKDDLSLAFEAALRIERKLVQEHWNDQCYNQNDFNINYIKDILEKIELTLYIRKKIKKSIIYL